MSREGPQKRWILFEWSYMPGYLTLFLRRRFWRARIQSDLWEKASRPGRRNRRLSSVPRPVTERPRQYWTSPVPRLGPIFWIHKDRKIRWSLNALPTLTIHGYIFPTVLFMASLHSLLHREFSDSGNQSTNLSRSPGSAPAGQHAHLLLAAVIRCLYSSAKKRGSYNHQSKPVSYRL